MVGETIGHFRIIARLGRGGMGEVWLAEQQSIGTKVAIKMLRPEISEDAAHVQRFFNEARAASKIHHAGIIKIFDVGLHAGRAYLVMEHLAGESLGARLRRVGRMRAGVLGEIGRQIASVLDATHAAGITHRDLKPDNIFLVPDRELGERVKILDFGIAKLAGTTSPGTHGTMGTPTYMAPEQWGDTSSVDWRADAYSLGCVAFEMACGRPPFVVTTFAEACAKHLGEIPPAARSLVPELPIVLDALLARLLQKRPADRADSMAEVARAFAAIATLTDPLGDTVAPPALAATLPSDQIPRDAPTVATGASTVDSTLGRAAAERAAPARSPSQPGIWLVAVAIAAAAGAGAIYVATRGGASVTTDGAVVAAARDAAIIAPDATAVVVAPADAAIDAAPAPAAPRAGSAQRTFPRDRDLAVEDFPEEPDHALTNKISEEIGAYARAHCGPFTPGTPVEVQFTISFGQADDVQVVASDAHAELCIAKLFRAAKFPLAKTALGMSISLAK